MAKTKRIKIIKKKTKRITQRGGSIQEARNFANEVKQRAAFEMGNAVHRLMSFGGKTMTQRNQWGLSKEKKYNIRKAAFYLKTPENKALYNLFRELIYPYKLITYEELMTDLEKEEYKDKKYNEVLKKIRGEGINNPFNFSLIILNDKMRNRMKSLIRSIPGIKEKIPKIQISIKFNNIWGMLTDSNNGGFPSVVPNALRNNSAGIDSVPNAAGNGGVLGNGSGYNALRNNNRLHNSAGIGSVPNAAGNNVTDNGSGYNTSGNT